MSPHEFSIPVHDLDAAGKEFHLPVRASWMRGVLEGTAVLPAALDGELDVRVSKSGSDVVVRGSVGAKLMVPCARCLEPASVQIREELSALAVEGVRAASSGGATGHAKDEDDADLEPDDVDLLAYDGDAVVLDDLVRDELLLAIPMIPLCSESCAGIQPPPVAEKPTEGALDPRLEPLRRLKK